MIANAFTEMGIDQVIGNLDGYLNVDTDFLFSDLIEVLPASRIVLELVERSIVDQRVVDRIAAGRSHPTARRCRSGMSASPSGSRGA